MPNVRKGDMAQVVRAMPGYEWLLGRVVKIARACCFNDAFVAWKFEEPQTHGQVSVKCAPDAHLKRLPPLSEDEAREVRAELAAPKAKAKRRVFHLEHQP